MNIHVKKLRFQQNVVLSSFYDFCGDQENQEDLDIFLKLLLTQNSDDYIGKFPIHGVFLVFDVNLKRTLESLPQWLSWFHRTCVKIGDSQGSASEKLIPNIRDSLSQIPVFFLGNKIDKLTKEASLSMKDISQRQDKQEKVDKVIQHIINYIRKKFTLVDFENLLMLGKKSTSSSFDYMDSLIISVFEKETGMMSDGIELGSFTMERCLSTNTNMFGADLNKGIANFFSKFFNRGETEPLPLYSDRV